MKTWLEDLPAADACKDCPFPICFPLPYGSEYPNMMASGSKHHVSCVVAKQSQLALGPTLKMLKCRVPGSNFRIPYAGLGFRV